MHEELQRKQAEADRAWRFLEEKCVPNLDIERAGKHKVTLTELLVEFRERAIAESQLRPSLDSLVGLLTQLRTYYIQRDDPKVANWCMRVITEAKELQL